METNYRKLVDEFEADDSKLLGWSGRKVYALDDSTVLKQAKFYRTPNRAEMAHWTRASERIRKLLAPVFYIDEMGEWLVMARADEVLNDDPDFAVANSVPGDADSSGNLLVGEWAKLRAQELVSAGDAEGYYDLHNGNLGWFGNTLKIIDYGASSAIA